MQKFEFLEHTADIKFKAFGKTMQECFANAGKALNESMCGLESIKAKIAKPLELDADNAEELLHKFLEEVLFEIQVEGMLFKEFELKIGETKNGRLELKGRIIGEKIDELIHEIKNDIKAVTWNEFYLKKTSEGWECQAVVDV